MNTASLFPAWCWGVGSLCATAATSGLAQNTNGDLALSRTATNLLLSWTGAGTVQSGLAPDGSWSDVLGAASPLRVDPTNGQQFFRLISRYSRRAGDCILPFGPCFQDWSNSPPVS